MKATSKKLVIEQMDQKMTSFRRVSDLPTGGWLKSIRTALGMTLHQCAGRMGITASSVKATEQREASGAITIKGLRSAGEALGMDLVYGFVPKGESLAQMIEQKAMTAARNIVMRADTTMKLEDQQVKKERLKKAIAELTEEIKREMPRYLWD